MNEFWARVRVFFKSAPTYLVAASAAVTILTEEISQELTGDVAANVVSLGGKAVSIIAAAVAIIRRVTPVLPDERGMLSPPKPINPADPAFDELDRGDITLTDVLLVLIAIGVAATVIKLY
jgi:hypothetical protein